MDATMGWPTIQNAQEVSEPIVNMIFDMHPYTLRTCVHTHTLIHILALGSHPANLLCCKVGRQLVLPLFNNAADRRG